MSGQGKRLDSVVYVGRGYLTLFGWVVNSFVSFASVSSNRSRIHSDAWPTSEKVMNLVPALLKVPST